MPWRIIVQNVRAWEFAQDVTINLANVSVWLVAWFSDSGIVVNVLTAFGIASLAWYNIERALKTRKERKQ